MDLKFSEDFELSKYEDELLIRFVRSVKYIRIGRKTTVCCIVLYSGFEITGYSACVNRKDFKVEVGRYYALKDALRKLDEFVGFAKQEGWYAM